MLVVRFMDITVSLESTPPLVVATIGVSTFGAAQRIIWIDDVISVVIKRQSRRNADAMQNSMLTNHAPAIRIQDFRPDTREW